MTRIHLFSVTSILLGLVLFPSKSLVSLANGNLFWWFQGIENVECVASIEDQDGDGVPEAVVMTYDAGAPPGDDLFLIKGNSSGYGEVIWSTKPYGGLSGGGGYGDQCLSTITDIGGDGRDDVLLGTAWGGRTAFAIAGDSGDIFFQHDSYQNPPSGWCYAVNPIEDLTGDGLDEVLAAFGNDTRAAYCFDGASSGDATVIWKWNADYDGVESIASIGDVNGDGYADAAAGCGGNFIDNRVVMIDGSSIGDPALTIWAYETGSTLQDVSPIRDVNGSGIDDVLAGGWDDYVYCIEGGSAGTGEVIWQRLIGTVVMKVESIRDVNFDGIDDVLVGSWDNAIVCLNGANGDDVWITPTGSLNGGDVWTISPIPDVDGDGIADVLAGSFDTKIYCVSGTTGQILWTYSTGNRLYTVRSIPDVNGDGIADAIGGTQMISGNGGKVYCIEGDSQGSWIEIAVEPDTQVVFAGDVLGMTVTIENTTPYPQTFDAWMEVKTPWGSTIPLVTEYGITIPGELSVSPYIELPVPERAPSGYYTVIVGAGDFGISVMDSDSFALEIINLPTEEDHSVCWALPPVSFSGSGANRLDMSPDFRAPSIFRPPYSLRDSTSREYAIGHRPSDSSSMDRYLAWAFSTNRTTTRQILNARRMGLGPTEE